MKKLGLKYEAKGYGDGRDVVVFVELFENIAKLLRVVNGRGLWTFVAFKFSHAEVPAQPKTGEGLIEGNNFKWGCAKVAPFARAREITFELCSAPKPPSRNPESLDDILQIPVVILPKKETTSLGLFLRKATKCCFGHNHFQRYQWRRLRV